MTFNVQNLKVETLNRGLIRSDMVKAHTAIVKDDESGDWIGVSRYVDEAEWHVDCAFRGNGYPIFSNGTGTRVTAGRGVADAVAEMLDAAAADYPIGE